MIANSLSRGVCAALVLVLGTACRAAAGPGDVRDLTLTTTISRTTIPAGGQSGVLEIRLSNHSGHPVSLSFPSSCQVLYYIETTDGKLTYPLGGGWGCLTVVTELDIGPGEEIVRDVEIRGGPAPAIYPPPLLPAGAYRAYAELGERPRPLLSSNRVTFSVVE